MVTEEQRKFIEHQDHRSIILSSVAGSGKTFSCVKRLEKLIERGVDPRRILFFSFTNAATDELKRRIDAPVEITTIHSFSSKHLTKSGRWKKIANFSEFVPWYIKNKKPKKGSTGKDRHYYDKNVRELREDYDKCSGEISRFKILQLENTKTRMPGYFLAYQEWLKKTYSRDFIDMISDMYYLSTSQMWQNNWAGKYDYVFIDEYQDTSSVQLRILLNLKAKQYHLVGDRNQMIYTFNGSNVDLVESILRRYNDVVEYNLTNNFRSGSSIVEHSNLYSGLPATPTVNYTGEVNLDLLGYEGLYSKLKSDEDYTILCRNNLTISSLETEFLYDKVVMSYDWLLPNDDIKRLKDGKTNPHLENRLGIIKGAFGDIERGIRFIVESRNKSKSHITTIHKSKGLEYDNVIVVNSLAPQQTETITKNLDSKKLNRLTFNEIDDVESRNIHYVACTRAKKYLGFMIHEDSI